MKNIIIILLFILVGASAFGSATDIFITASGSPSGPCTANVKTPDFFNTPANWGTSQSQIGPGTTVHLCGVFNGAYNSTMLSAQGSGASGQPITGFITCPVKGRQVAFHLDVVFGDLL